jgi:hypothetical protein
MRAVPRKYSSANDNAGSALLKLASQEHGSTKFGRVMKLTRVGPSGRAV